MPPLVVRLPFPDADEEELSEDVPSPHQSGNHISSDILHGHVKQKVMTPKRAAAPSRPRHSLIQAAQPTPERRRPQSESATESEGENAATARTPATTPSTDGSASKRKRTEVSDSNSEDEPHPATKRKGGKNEKPKGHVRSSRKASKKAAGEKEDDGDAWEVERIVGARIEADTYVHWYEVKWKGYSAKHNTWEPKKNLASCQDLIEAFEVAEREESKAKKQSKTK